MGAPKWPPYPQRSGRPGKAVAPSTSVGAGSALEGPRDGPPYPQRSGRPGKAVAPSTSVGAGSALEGPRHGPSNSPTLGTPRQSRGALDNRPHTPNVRSAPGNPWRSSTTVHDTQ